MKNLLLLLCSITFICSCDENNTSPDTTIISSIDSTVFITYFDEILHITDADSFDIDADFNYDIKISQYSYQTGDQDCYVCRSNNYSISEIKLDTRFSVAGYYCENDWSPFCESYITNKISFDSILCWLTSGKITEYNSWSRYGYETNQNDSIIEINESGIYKFPVLEEADFLYLPIKESNENNNAYKYGWIKYTTIENGITVYEIKLTKDYVRFN